MLQKISYMMELN